LGVNEIVLGMAHRGRLNTLCCVFKKSYAEMLAEFEGVYGKNSPVETIPGYMGDVKYHNGTYHEINLENGQKFKMSLLTNPSHLEVINSLVVGMTKARQDSKNDNKGVQTLPIMIHGDAAVAGQGINYEVSQFESVKNFEVGGAIHLIFNNQVGFTAS
jgi:2-oxoglutarate dehydrogenase E1 component